MAGKNWRRYQERTAQLFRAFGFEAKVDAALEGDKGSQIFDVVVTVDRFGREFWVAECKFWRNPINKDHVLAFRAKIEDVKTFRARLLNKNWYSRTSVTV
ncbi:restriction endonuclease [Acidobacteria bacterium AH-259-A15]|nr:restriction endonuclease [Acidobacteria bacterium AH-259-A15]